MLGESDARLITAKIYDSPALAPIVGSPTLLPLLAAVYFRFGTIPNNRFVFFSAAVEALLTREAERGHIGREAASAAGATQLFLPELAWDMQQRQTLIITGKELTKILFSAAQRSSIGDAAEAFVRNARSYTSLFLTVGTDLHGEELFSFAHRSIQEYFAAVQLVRHWQRLGEKVLAQVLQRFTWSSVISLASAGLSVREASLFVRQILRNRSSSSGKYELMLAGECLVAGAMLDSELAREIIRGISEILAHDDSLHTTEAAEVEELLRSLGAGN
jgi:predicted NACHT family NTPase